MADLADILTTAGREAVKVVRTEGGEAVEQIGDIAGEAAAEAIGQTTGEVAGAVAPAPAPARSKSFFTLTNAAIAFGVWFVVFRK